MKSLTLIPQSGEYDALVNRVIDGDTLEVFLLVPIKVRINGIQVAEKKTEKGKSAAAILKPIEKTVVRLTMHGTEKYGRTLAAVKSDTLGDIAAWLIGQGMGVPWDGRGARPVGSEEP